MKRYLLFFLKLLLFTTLPFIVLLKGAVYLHELYAWNAWLCIAGGMLGSSVILLLYFWYASFWFTGNAWNTGLMKRGYFVLLVLVLTYCVPSLLVLSASNAKHESVQQEFTSLHPILRLSISTLILLDSDLLITDANRQPEDYRQMGLPIKANSLHYPQSNGYAHAIDLRTKGHSDLRNFMIALYFRAIGLNTLRHVGTADHLHVSLLSHDRPGAI
ncbi:MAG: hypothetical protein AAF798_13675 [Bacteroidota bacterium]